jgi:hypothetical protein
MNEHDEREQEPVPGDLELGTDSSGAHPSEVGITAQATGTNTDDAGTSRERRVSRTRRPRVQRSFPAAPFEEALELPLAIQRLAAGMRIRRIRLFELLERSPDSGPSRQLITNSARYGLITGNYNSEWIELTDDGRMATADNVPEREKIRARFKLAIEQIPPFNKLHARFVNNRLPAKSVMADFLIEDGLSQEEVLECVETFLLNAKFVGVLQSVSGAERLLPLDYVLDYAPSGVIAPTPLTPPPTQRVTVTTSAEVSPRATDTSPTAGEQWENICFYITPIGEEGSEARLHADLFLGSIIEPALEEFGLKVICADKIGAAGMISRQVIEHIMRARLVIADLSFHNPNVFYELALRHASGLPTVQVIRTADRLPFDVDQVRTIRVDTSSIYALVPQLEVYRAAIASQVRRALENPEAVDNPVTAFYPALRTRGG